MKKISLFLVLFLVINSTANAVLPVLVWAVARQAAVYTAESVAIGVIAKGFAANDPYVRTTATLPRTKFARGLSLLRGRWAGLAVLTSALASLGWGYDEDIGFFVPKRNPYQGHCAASPSSVDYDSCALLYFGAPINYSVTPLHRDDLGNYVLLCMSSVDASGYCTNNIGGKFIVTGGGEPSKIPVTEFQMNREAIPLIAASPNTLGDMFAGASPDMLNKLFDGATIPYNATNPTPEMAQLKADYRNGLLQSLDPNADHYVTPEQMKQIQDLVAAEDAANTDDGTIDALNEKMKQPITQAQYEETNKKYSDAVDAVTNTLPNNDADSESIDDSFNKLDGIITDIPNTTLPSPAHIQLPHYTECMTLNLTDGKGRELVFPSSSQCEKINQMKSLIGYFLAGLVAMGLIWQLLTRPHG